MKKILSIFAISIFAVSCSNKDNKIVSKDTVVIKNVSNARQTKYLNNLFSNLNNFDILTGNTEIDSLLHKYSNHKGQINKNYCWGDCCGSNKKIIDSITNTKIFIFKSDCGEYGFGNDQFVFYNDTLRIVRNYNYGIETFPTDTSNTVFYLEEIITQLDNKNTLIKTRRKTFTDDDNNDFSLDKTRFNIKDADFDLILKNRLNELNKQIEAEKETVHE